MGLVEGILIVAATLALAGAVLTWARRRSVAPDDPIDEVLGAAHDGIDEIELARVRSMLQRR
jgi:hypothetical protein